MRTTFGLPIVSILLLAAPASAHHGWGRSDASKVAPGEMRAERITVDGKTVEMR